MTAGRFYQLLEVASKTIKFKEVEQPGSKLQNVLLGKYRYGNHLYDPITAVYKLVTNRQEDFALSSECARELKLNGKFANKVMDASDNVPWSSQKVRRRLLKAVGLASGVSK